MNIDLRGIYPAFLTPLTSDRKFNPAVAERMIDHLLQSGIHGTYVAGTTGEGLLLPAEERRLLVETLAHSLPKDKKLIVHVGASQKQDAFKLAEHAARHGAHAISSLPPKGDSSTVMSYYSELAAISPLPLIVYYFPKIAPHAFAEPEKLIDVCDLPNVLGVKFTDFNFYLLQRLVKRGKLVFNGYDEALAAGLLMGAQGGIGSTYNVMPEVYLSIYRAAAQGDWNQARRLQIGVNDVIETLLKYPFFPALRAIMQKKGLDCGPLMSGEQLPSDASRQQLLTEFEQVTQRLQSESRD
ncbi:dihydrodipicolinate synthase family protein [Edaphobacter albus]|uniref:dihydrodipicolinate synthase family protein n=1 Tax=Edaphobacter sp. 4G125 TaxID=2763071 RepID=UPI001645D77B|nr:dihydrodipicolinate synthase family protein [Edaphobacter sp. 4G125]QNI37641.1 dihydrodipicolinate synthase family protein [Edaphobacter sp. 4G125]